MSLLLIAGAVTLLVFGLGQSSSALLGASIAASLLAAVVLVVGARRAAAVRREHAPDVAEPDHAPPSGAEPVTTTIPVQQAPPREADGHAGEVDDDDVDPPDEPAPQQVSAADAARVGRMLTEVLVVDGRPRYHLPGCVHLMGRDSEPLPVGEAIELGFTPCSLCEPDSALLAEARRV